MGKICICIIVLCIFASSQAKKHRRHEHISKDVDQQSVEVGSENEKPRHHSFAIAFSIPRIRLLPDRMAMDMKEMKDKNPNVKTTTKTSNSTNGPFRTFTVTEESVSRDNKTNSSVIMETVKSVTTLDKNLTPEQRKKLASGELQDDEHHNEKLPNLFHWNFRLPFGISADKIEAPKPECDGDKKCESGHFCDDGACMKKLAPGARCDKKDQCDSESGKYQCTWGVCALNSDSGSPGTFCDDDSSCDQGQDMTCRFQNDVSLHTKVCLPKLGEEGALCGKVSFFGFFTDDHDFNICKTGLMCKVVGFRGIKRCVKENEFPESLVKDTSSNDEKTTKETEPATNKEEEDTKHDESEEKLVFTSKHHHHHRH